MSEHVLVVNSGSSSIKYQLIDTDTGASLASGLVERIGQETSRSKHETADGSHVVEEPVADHDAGMAHALAMFAEFGPEISAENLSAIGHRVVQGGSVFAGPALIDDDVLQQISDLSSLAPLHNPAHVAGIIAARRAFPTVAHVAVFDTSFHTTLPPAAYTYAIDRELAARYAIRRYGAHGTSHHYVSRKTAELLGKDPSEVNVIVLHLGNGASVTAVRGGVSVETSMGLTPLQGLVMGTRSGDIDPAVIFHLQRVAGMSTDDIDDLLNRRSGMLGMSGSSDMRDVHDAVAAGDEAARTALEVYCHRIQHYIGAYYALLGKVDALAFTAGIGENDDIVRLRTLTGLDHLGIVVDAERNEGRKRSECVISADGSPITVFVVPTNEELEIAQEAVALLRGRR